MGHKLAIEICVEGEGEPIEMDFEAPNYVELLEMAIKCLQELKRKAESVKVLGDPS